MSDTSIFAYARHPELHEIYKHARLIAGEPSGPESARRQTHPCLSALLLHLQALEAVGQTLLFRPKHPKPLRPLDILGPVSAPRRVVGGGRRRRLCHVSAIGFLLQADVLQFLL